MGNKKRTSDAFEESVEKTDLDVRKKSHRKVQKEVKGEGEGGEHLHSVPSNINPMERKKRRKALDKEKRQINAKISEPTKPISLIEATEVNDTSLSFSSAWPQLHLDHFSNLSSADESVRQAAVEALANELLAIQKMYETHGKNGMDLGDVILEAEKDDSLKSWHPDLTYAIGRLIRGASSSRAYSRQGFALGLSVVLSSIPGIKVAMIMKLIVNKIEVSSSMKGQEARDCLLGRLFAYGALALSGRLAEECMSGSTSCVEEFVNAVLSLAENKRYLCESAATIILDMIEKLPVDVVASQVLEVETLCKWFQFAPEIGNTEALLLALKIREKISVDSEHFGNLLPKAFSPNSFFTAAHLSSLLPCFKESIFCQPRVHILWPVIVNLLLPDTGAPEEDQSVGSSSLKKYKRSRKCNSSEEEISKCLRSFCEVVIEGCLLLSSHDRKHLAFEILLLILPRLSFLYVSIVLSFKLVQCLMDILSTSESLLFKAAQRFLKELSVWIGDDDSRRVEVIVALQKHSYGKFDCITRTHTVKEFVSGFRSSSGCEDFVQRLQKVFVDEGNIIDEPSDQSQTTDENSDTGSLEDRGPGPSGNADILKNWVIESLPCVLKNSHLDVETRSNLQVGILEFLTVQGLFSASLGSEVTSFELQKKFKWPKAAISSAMCGTCIEQLQLLLADAFKVEGARIISKGFDMNDLGSHFMRLLGPLCNIPSVSLFRQLSREDDRAFKKLREMESLLSHEERKNGPGTLGCKVHAMRYLLIQLLLQILLRQGDFSEAAVELVLCCKKAFFQEADIIDGDSDEEDGYDQNGAPELMDVLIDTLLSLLPQSSSPMSTAIEQVFRFFCHEITDAGLVRMLQIIKKDLKRGRHQTVDDNEEDDDEEDLLGLEEEEEIEEDGEEEVVDTGDSDDHAGGTSTTSQHVKPSNAEGSHLDDESDGGMDDDAMFRMDSYLVRIFKERKSTAGSDNAHSQLVLFKLRVLSLLEIYVQKNSGNPQVVTVFSYLFHAFIRSHSGQSTDQLGHRISGILQKKLFKAKEYPKGDEVQMNTLENLLEKSLKTASRSRFKTVSALAQSSTFWILKVIHARDLPESAMQEVLKTFQQALLDYFDCKKCRMKPGFLKEVFQRNPWLGEKLFGFLLEKCSATKSEYRKIEALDLVEAILKSCLTNKSCGENETNGSQFVAGYMCQLADLIGNLLVKLPEKQSRRSEVRKFCSRTIRMLQTGCLKELLVKSLKADSYAACQSQLGELFLDWSKK